MKRILSFLLVLTMLCSFGPAFAQEEAPAEEPAAEEVIETAPEETAAEEPAEEPAEEAAEIPVEEPAEEPAEAPAEEIEAGPTADGDWYMRDSAETIDIGGSSEVIFYGSGDEALFKFTPAETGTYTFCTCSDQYDYYGQSYKAFLYDYEDLYLLNPLASTDSSAGYYGEWGADIRLECALKAGKTYIFRIYADDDILEPSEENPLGFTVSVTKTYASITAGNSYSGSLAGETNSVVYEFVPNDSGSYIFRAAGENGAEVYAVLYDTADNCLAGGSFTESRLECSLTAGTIYRFKVFSAGDADYTISLAPACSISYNANGGSGAPSAQLKVIGETTQLASAKPTRDGYIFLGWAVNNSQATKQDYLAGADYSADGDVTLYAVWKLLRTSGTCGDNLTWELNEDGVLTISGTGLMLDYDGDDDAPWKVYEDHIYTAVIEDGVESIGAYAFWSLDKLTGITIADSVQAIGRGAFKECISLHSVVIPDGVTVIESNTFSYCWGYDPEGLQSVTIPASVKEIREDAFAECYDLEDVYYGGTKADRDALIIGDGNEYLTGDGEEDDAVWHYTVNIDAAALTACRSYTAKIAEDGGTVWYTYTPADSKTYVLYTTGTEDVTITLYDADCGELQTGTDGRLSCAMTAGETYYYTVGYADESMTGSIALKFGRAYTIKYNAAGGTGAPEAQEKDYGRSLTLADTRPTREGYFFLGWSAVRGAETPTYTAGGTYTANGNTTLYAVWVKTTALTACRSYTAKITKAGGAVWYAYTPTESKTFVLYVSGSADAQIALYNAAGELLTSERGVGARAACAMTAGETYLFRVSLSDSTAAGSIGLKFGRVYTVKYNANKGTGAPTAQTRDWGDTLWLTEDTPTRTGYTFAGWSTVKNGAVSYQRGEAYRANSNATLYAVWEAES